MKFTYQSAARPVEGYTIHRGIHRGGFGEVYYAVSDAGKEVALKLLTHDLDTELRGIRQCLNLKHPNLVTLFDVKTDSEGDQWVVMEYVHGSSLDDVLAAFPQGLPAAEVRDWLQGICAGVEYLHDRGIVHRDLKPANVYRENGVVKIGDVGLSKRMGGNPRSQHTESVGTVYYMAPEVAQGKYGPGVDIYSLGVMTYEMLTGRLPFDGETTAEILMKHLTQPVDLKPLPAAVRTVVARALEKDPQQRYANVRAFADDLQIALGGSTPIPDSAFMPPAPPRLRRDTDRERDTSRGPAAAHPPRLSPHPAKDGQPTSRRLRSTHRRKGPWWTAWLPWAAVAAVFFVPWSRMAWAEISMVLSVAALWGAGLYALAWWCTPVEDRLWFRSSSANVSEAGVEAGGVSFAEQLSRSLLLGALLAGTLTSASLMALSWIEPNWVRPLPTSTLGLMLGVSAIATSVLLVLSQKSQGLLKSWGWTAGLGVAVGAAAYALDEFLLAQFPDLRDASESAFRYVGAHPLWDHGQPTVVAYMVFFAGLLGLQDWPKLLNPFRSQRLSLGAIAWAGGVGWFVSMLFGVPRPCAIVWAVSIAAAAQLAAPWQPGMKRTA